MIQALQGLDGLLETREAALRGWRAMSPAERENTALAYQVLILGEGHLGGPGASGH